MSKTISTMSDIELSEHLSMIWDLEQTFKTFSHVPRTKSMDSVIRTLSKERAKISVHMDKRLDARLG